MEMIIPLLLSLNKISLIGFFITLIFVLYQFRLLMKEIKQKKTKLIIPEFKETTIELTKTSPNLSVSENKRHIYKKSVFTNIIASIILLAIFGLIIFFGLTKKQIDKEIDLTTPTPMINLITTAGIKIYNENWTEMSDKELTKLKPGTKIIVGIETIDGLAIDMARIRINNNNWDKEDITIRFNQQKKVFYREYQISTKEAYLKIEAQLHSSNEGWLGD